MIKNWDVLNNQCLMNLFSVWDFERPIHRVSGPTKLRTHNYIVIKIPCKQGHPTGVFYEFSSLALHYILYFHWFKLNLLFYWYFAQLPSIHRYVILPKESMFGNWRQSNTIHVSIKVGVIQTWNKSETLINKAMYSRPSAKTLHILFISKSRLKCSAIYRFYY